MALEVIDIENISSLWKQAQDVTSLEREDKPPIENLVFEGGGVKGLVYASALMVMEEYDMLKDIKRVAGSSAGGIVSLLLAVGYSPTEIHQIMMEEIDFQKLMDRRVLFDPTRVIQAAGMKLGVSDLYMLFKNKGVFKGEAFVELAKMFVKRKIEQKLEELIKEEHKNEIIALKGQLLAQGLDKDAVDNKVNEYIIAQYDKILEDNYINNLENITFGQLKRLNEKYPQLNFKELYVTGTRLSDASLKVFSADSDPEMSIVDAVRITMSFPLGFEPVLYQGELWADGGIASNYPMQIFDQEKFLSHGLNDAKVNPCTLGFLVDSQSEIDARWGISEAIEDQELDIKGFIGGILQGMQNRPEMLKDLYNINSIQIFDEAIDTLEFSLSEEKKNMLSESGRKAMQFYVDNYFGKGIGYSMLPDYKDVIEKYYSKQPQELIRILENDLWPVLQEVHTYLKQLNSIDLDSELIEINKQIDAYTDEDIDEQQELLEMMDTLSTALDIINNDNQKVKDKIEENEIKQRNIWRSIDDLQGKPVSKDDYARLYALQAKVFQERDDLNNKLSKIDDLISDKRKDFISLRKRVNQPLFDLLESKSRIVFIQESELQDKLKQTEIMLHEQMDVLLDALKTHKKDYPDPRVRHRLEKDLFVLSEKRIKELKKHYMRNYDYAEEKAIQYAIQQNNFIDELISFGISIKESKTLSANYMRMIDLLRTNHEDHEILNDVEASKVAKRRIFHSLILGSLDELKLLDSDNSDDVTRIKEYIERYVDDLVAKQSDISLGEAYFLAKERIIDLRREEKSIKESKKIEQRSKDVKNKETVFYKYALSLQDITSKLSTGKWGNNIPIERQDDIQYNMEHMRTVDGQTYSKHSSNYSCTSLSSKDAIVTRGLIFNRVKKLPAIKAHILKPHEALLNNPEYPVKEIVVAFEPPAMLKRDKQFSIISNYSNSREAQFNSFKNDLLKQLKWSIRQSRESIIPKDAKFKITLTGEGLAGQDAQYLLAELIKEMKESENPEDLAHISDINLVLIDPSRVREPLAVSTAQAIHELKSKNNKLNISGYNLIHKNGIATKSLRRKAQNFIGETNILSKVDPKDAFVVADFRNVHDSYYQYNILSNKEDPKLVDEKLNKSNLFYRSAFFRKVNLAFKRAKSATKFISLDLFPRLTKMILKIPYNSARFFAKKCSNLISAIAKKFKAKKEISNPIPKWTQAITNPEGFSFSQSQETDSRVDTRVHSQEIEIDARHLIEQASPSVRLKREGRPPIENLVFVGSVVKGLGFLGALDEMHQYGMLRDVKRIAASSFGAIPASLYAIGAHPSDLVSLFQNEVDFEDLLDPPFSLGGVDDFIELNGLEIGFSGIINLFKNKGLYKGDKFKQFTENLLQNRLETTFKSFIFSKLTTEEQKWLLSEPPHLTNNERDIRIDEYLKEKVENIKKKYNIDDFGRITFGQLQALSKDYPELNFKDIYITGTSLSDASLKVFSAETEPDMPIVDAIRITMSYPGGFVPVKYKGKYYVDGSVALKYPMSIFDDDRFLSHGLNDARVNPCTLGFLVDPQEEIEARWGIISDKKEDYSLFKFVGAVLEGIHNRSELLREKYDINSIQISDNIADDTDNYVGAKTLDVHMKKKQRKRLVDNGREALRSYYSMYMAEDVAYFPHEVYDNLMQKYFSKSVIELNAILENEIDPLIEQFDENDSNFRERMSHYQSELAVLDSQTQEMDKLELLVEKLVTLEDEEMAYFRLVKTSMGREHELEELIAFENDAMVKTLEELPEDENNLSSSMRERLKEHDRNIKKYTSELSKVKGDFTFLNNQKARIANDRSELIQRMAPYSQDSVDKLRRKIDILKKIALLEQVEDSKKFILEERSIILKALQAKGVDKKQVTELSTTLTHSKKLSPPLISSKIQKSSASIANPELVVTPTSTTNNDISFSDSHEFISIFAKIFPKDDWECYIKNQNYKFQRKSQLNQVVHIERSLNDVKFSGIPIEKIVHAATTYYDVMTKDKPDESETVELDYKVNAKSLDQARAFIVQLHESGFDISKINDIVCKDTPDIDVKTEINLLLQSFQNKKSQPQLLK